MPTKEELVTEIIELQRKIERGRRQYEVEVWMGLSLSIAQLKSLFFISNSGTTNLANLAAALKVTPTNASGIVERLVKKEMVSRGENAGDRRMLSLKVTARGEQLLARLREKRRGYMKEVLGNMNVTDLESLRGGYTALYKSAQLQEIKSGK